MDKAIKRIKVNNALIEYTDNNLPILRLLNQSGYSMLPNTPYQIDFIKNEKSNCLIYFNHYGSEYSFHPSCFEWYKEDQMKKINLDPNLVNIFRDKKPQPSIDYKQFYENVKIHMEMMVTPEMRHHGYVCTDHDLDFQIFRLLSGYSKALEEMQDIPVDRLLDIIINKSTKGES